MRKNAQAWINASNREESMARVLSRALLGEGAVLHFHRAAASALKAVFAEKGWVHTSDRCADLCAMLDAHDVAPTTDVLRAADLLDRRLSEMDLERAGELPAGGSFDEAAAECLAALKNLRAFVNSVLSR